jgi:hypothetical protein
VVFLRGLAVWFVIILAETLHGVARTILLEPQVGDLRARQITTFTGAAIILTIALIFIRWIRARSVAQLIGVGLLWLGLTVLFELLLGRYVLGYSWDRLAADYRPREGGLMPIGLLILTLAPLLAAKLRGVV